MGGERRQPGPLSPEGPTPGVEPRLPAQRPLVAAQKVVAVPARARRRLPSAAESTCRAAGAAGAAGGRYVRPGAAPLRGGRPRPPSGHPPLLAGFLTPAEG